MPVAEEYLADLARDLLDPRRFYAPGQTLRLAHVPAERMRWELFQGRLLDPAHTRVEKTFATWSLISATVGVAQKLLGLQFDAETKEVHVVRWVESYVWEGYDAGGGVIESRERQKWVQELVATIRLVNLDDEKSLGEELAVAIRRAVVGARLPLTPVEAPLPDFSFGKIAYGPVASAPDAPDALLRDWLAVALDEGNGHRVVEAWLRANVGRVPREAAEQWTAVWRRTGRPWDAMIPVVRAILDDTSLSPWTPWVELLLDVLEVLEEWGHLTVDSIVDLYSSLIRLLGRHLTAYDLATFHYRGANYPDALLLDTLLTRLCRFAEEAPERFAGEGQRLRRRAVRQGYLIRRRYEGHPVPEVPTSPGERSRVFPYGVARVTEEQILQPARRKAQLFRDDPLLARLGPEVKGILRQSVEDLQQAPERGELGFGVFLDRPLGGAKQPVEPDATPLIASLGYSRFIAGQRLRLLGRDLGLVQGDVERLSELLEIPGINLDAIGPPSRPGTVSLLDAARTSSDFVFLHTMKGSRRQWLDLFDWGDFGTRLAAEAWLLVRAPVGQGLNILLGATGSVWMEIAPQLEQGYRAWRGVELPVSGLEVSMPGQPSGERTLVRPRWRA